MKQLFLSLLLIVILDYQSAYPQTGWLRQVSPANENLTAVSFVNANTGYVGGYKKVLRTTNSGSSWIFTDTSLLQGACSKLIFLNSLTGYVINQSILLRTTNGGSSWASCPPVSGCNDLSFVDSIHGFARYGSNYFLTSDGGANWVSRYVYGMGDPLGFDFGELNFGSFNFGIYTSLWINSLRARYEVYIYKTTDQMGWFCVHGFVLPDSCIYWWAPFGNMQLPFYSVYLIDGTAGFLYGGYNSSVIYKTTNTGNNWTALSAGAPIRSFCFTDHDTGFAASSGEIQYTSDCGSSWLPQYTGVNSQINFIDMLSTLTGWAVGDSGVILKTTTGGQITVPPPASLLDPRDGATGVSLTPLLQWMQMFACPVTFSYKVMLAADSLFGQIRDSATVSNNFYQVPSGKLQNSTRYFWEVRAISSVYGAGPWSAIYSFTTNLTSITRVGSAVPCSFALYQNYPNPFNPSTKIKFQIAPPLRTNGAPLPPSGGDVPAVAGSVGVRLIIYDALGREVATLVNEQLQPGTYEAEWDGTNYPSGVYFYKLTAGDFVQTKKMVLVK